MVDKRDLLAFMQSLKLRNPERLLSEWQMHHLIPYPIVVGKGATRKCRYPNNVYSQIRTIVSFKAEGKKYAAIEAELNKRLQQSGMPEIDTAFIHAINFKNFSDKSKTIDFLRGFGTLHDVNFRMVHPQFQVPGISVLCTATPEDMENNLLTFAALTLRLKESDLSERVTQHTKQKSVETNENPSWQRLASCFGDTEYLTFDLKQANHTEHHWKINQISFDGIIEARAQIVNILRSNDRESFRDQVFTLKFLRSAISEIQIQVIIGLELVQKEYICLCSNAVDILINLFLLFLAEKNVDKIRSKYGFCKHCERLFLRSRKDNSFCSYECKRRAGLNLKKL